MNIKVIIGVSLTFIGMIGFVFAVVWYFVMLNRIHDERIAITSGLLSIIFFATGIALLNATKMIRKI